MNFKVWQGKCQRTAGGMWRVSGVNVAMDAALAKMDEHSTHFVAQIQALFGTVPSHKLVMKACPVKVRNGSAR